MKELYVGYVDQTNKNTLDSALFAKFDSSKLSKEEKEALFDFFNGNEDASEEMLDHTRPIYIYMGADFLNDPEGEFFVNKVFNEDWSFFVGNVYKTYEEAKKAFIEESMEKFGLSPEAIFIKSVFEKQYF